MLKSQVSSNVLEVSAASSDTNDDYLAETEPNVQLSSEVIAETKEVTQQNSPKKILEEKARS